MRLINARCWAEHFVPREPCSMSVAAVQRHGRCCGSAVSFCVTLGVGITAFTVYARASEATWPAYGGDQGGTRYSTADQINATTVGDLRVEWTYRTGDMLHRNAA